MPAKEVTFANLNDNIDGKFLEEMCAKFGEILECRIYYNLKTKKHLGLGKVLFQSQRSAKECCLHFNQTSKMGNLMSVFLDTMGLERSKMVDSLCNNVTSSSSTSQNIASNLIRYYYLKFLQNKIYKQHLFKWSSSTVTTTTSNLTPVAGNLLKANASPSQTLELAKDNPASSMSPLVASSSAISTTSSLLNR